MLPISDKVRNYRMVFRPPVYYAIKTKVFWLSTFLAAIILLLTFIDLYVRLKNGQELLSSSGQAWLLFYEIPLMFGFFQIYMSGIENRHRKHYPSSRYISLRVPEFYLSKEKREYIRKIFSHSGDLSVLAERLIREWEWRREIKHKAKDLLWHRAIRFFGLPSASNFAAYMTGFIAIFAGVVIATLNSDAILLSPESVLLDAKKIIYQLWLLIVLPVGISILPVAAIFSFVKLIGEAAFERIDDQFLSNSAFYRFVQELLDLHDRGDRPLQLKTRARVYWVVRVLSSPIGDVRRIFRAIGRVKRLARMSRFE